jgi:hypothetical protein
MKTAFDILAQDQPENFSPENGEHIDDIIDTINDHRFDLPLSTSVDRIVSKEQGGPKIDFRLKTYRSDDQDALRELFTTQSTSTNIWNGTRCEKNYIGCTGVGLDFDGGISIEAIRKMFAKFNYILYTSTSHMVEKHGVVAPRFRLYLPFAPGPLRFTSPIECKKVYFKLVDAIPEMDSDAVGPARQFFPFTGMDPDKFELFVNATGRYFDVDISDVPDDIFGSGRSQEWDGKLRPKEELDRIVKFCPFVRWMIANIDNPKVRVHEPMKFALISNLCWYEGGRELIHDILRRDARPEKYDSAKVDAKIAWVLHNAGPHRYSVIALKDRKLAPMWGWSGENWKGPAAPAGWGKFGRIYDRKGFGKNEEIRINYDDDLIVQIDGQWTVTDLETIKRSHLPNGKLATSCPFCDSENAKFQTDMFNAAYFACPDCKKECFEFPLAPNMFTYKNEILRVEQREGLFSSIEVLTKEHFRIDDDYFFVKKLLLNSQDRRFLDDSFQIRRVGSADSDNLGYEINIKENALVHRFPPVPVQVEDNAFVDRFLETMFGQYADFIKDWMALYSYTNYVTLPVVVLQGERSCGKGTFAQIVGGIYPRLMGYWNGDSNNFNEYFRSKLLFVDENDKSEKRIQYTEIKKLTGNKVVRINEKYKPEYYAPNNNNLIISTNDTRPVYLDWKEMPKAENVNNFFIYQCPDVPAEAIIPDLEDKLKARMGYYVRTELKARYQTLAARGFQNNRYALAAPITEFARNLFGSSKPLVQIETDELAQYIVCGVDMPDSRSMNAPNIQFRPRMIDGKAYIRPDEIRDLVDRLHFKGGRGTYKPFITTMQDMKVISPTLDRDSNQRFGYQILRSKEYYTTTASGIMPVNTGAVSTSADAKCSILEMPSGSSGIRIFA